MYGVYEFSVRFVQSYVGGQVLEVRLCRVKTSDATKPFNLFSSIATSVGAQRVSNALNISWVDSKFFL